MAISGIVLAHMVGDLRMYLGAEDINHFDEIGGDGEVELERSGNEFPAFEAYQTKDGQTQTVLQSPARTHGYRVDGPAGVVFRALLTCDYNPFC